MRPALEVRRRVVGEDPVAGGEAVRVHRLADLDGLVLRIGVRHRHPRHRRDEVRRGARHAQDAGRRAGGEDGPGRNVVRRREHDVEDVEAGRSERHVHLVFVGKRALREGGLARELPVEAEGHVEPGVAQHRHVREADLEVVFGHALAGLVDRRDEMVVDRALDDVVLPELEAVRAPLVQFLVAEFVVRELDARPRRVADEPARIGHADRRVGAVVHLDQEVPAVHGERAVRRERNVVRRRHAEPERVGAGLRERRHGRLPLVRPVTELADERVEVGPLVPGHGGLDRRHLRLARVVEVRGRDRRRERCGIDRDHEGAAGVVVVRRGRLELDDVRPDVRVGRPDRVRPFVRPDAVLECDRLGVAEAVRRHAEIQVVEGLARVERPGVGDGHRELRVRDDVFRTGENELVVVGDRLGQGLPRHGIDGLLSGFRVDHGIIVPVHPVVRVIERPLDDVVLPGRRKGVHRAVQGAGEVVAGLVPVVPARSFGPAAVGHRVGQGLPLVAVAPGLRVRVDEDEKHVGHDGGVHRERVVALRPADGYGIRRGDAVRHGDEVRRQREAHVEVRGDRGPHRELRGRRHAVGIPRAGPQVRDADAGPLERIGGLDVRLDAGIHRQKVDRGGVERRGRLEERHGRDVVGPGSPVEDDARLVDHFQQEDLVRQEILRAGLVSGREADPVGLVAFEPVLRLDDELPALPGEAGPQVEEPHRAAGGRRVAFEIGPVFAPVAVETRVGSRVEEIVGDLRIVLQGVVLVGHARIRPVELDGRDVEGGDLVRIHVGVGVLAGDEAHPVGEADGRRREHGLADADGAGRDPDEFADAVPEILLARRAVEDEDVVRLGLDAGPVGAVADVGDAAVVVAARHRDARILGDRVAAVDLVGDQDHAVAAVAALPVGAVVVGLLSVVVSGTGAAAAARAGVLDAGRGGRAVADVRRVAADAGAAAARLGEVLGSVRGGGRAVDVSAAAARAVEETFAGHGVRHAGAAGAARRPLVERRTEADAPRAAAAAGRDLADRTALQGIVAAAAGVAVGAVVRGRAAVLGIGAAAARRAVRADREALIVNITAAATAAGDHD